MDFQPHTRSYQRLHDPSGGLIMHITKKRYTLECNAMARTYSAPSEKRAVTMFCGRHFGTWYPPYKVEDGVWEVCNSFTTVKIKVREAI